MMLGQFFLLYPLIPYFYCALFLLVLTHYMGTMNCLRNLMCVSVQRCVCVEKKNQLDATEWFIELIICSTCFGHFYAHHQEPETICVLLPPMVSDTLVAGCRRSGAGRPAMRPGWGMLLEQRPSPRTHLLPCTWPPTTSNQGTAHHRR